MIKATEAAGKMTVGYHADASSLAPKGWLTGSEWNWGALYTDIVKTAVAGKFTGSKYNANYRVGYKTGENPFVQSKFGPIGRPRPTKAKIAAAKKAISHRRLAVHRAGVRPRTARCSFAAGDVPDYATIECHTTSSSRASSATSRRADPSCRPHRAGPPVGGPTLVDPIGPDLVDSLDLDHGHPVGHPRCRHDALPLAVRRRRRSRAGAPGR